MNHRFVAILLIHLVSSSLHGADFSRLHESEILDMQTNAAGFLNNLKMTQKSHELLLNYLFIAARSAKHEHALIEEHEAFQRNLTDIKESQLLPDEERLALAHRFISLTRSLMLRSDYAKALHMLEDILDQDEQCLISVKTLSQHLQEVLREAFESRDQAISRLLLASGDTLQDDTFSALGKFYKGLAQEQELLLSESTVLGRIDTMYRLTGTLNAKITSIARVRDTLHSAAYFSLLVTHHYFKECYAQLCIKYQDTYHVSPQLLFNSSGTVSKEHRYALSVDELEKDI